VQIRRFYPLSQFLTANMLAVIMLLSLAGCGGDSKSAQFEKLIKSSNKARSIGHEDLAANDLKEALEFLPATNDPDRVTAVNIIYPEILALAADLRKSGRLSLSNTMYDRAIEIERECTIAGKESAISLKQETEKMFDMEENILTEATTSNDLRKKENELAAITIKYEEILARGDYAKVHGEGMKHFERIRSVSGEAGQLHNGMRKVILNLLKAEDRISEAIALVKRDVKALDTFTDEDLKKGNEDSIQNAYFLRTALAELALLQAEVGDLQEAEVNARRSLSLTVMLGGKLVQEKAMSQFALAEVLRVKGQNAPALSLAKDSYDLLERARSGSSNKLCCLTLSVQAEAALGNKKNAEKACDLIIEIAKEARATDATVASLACASVYFQNSGNEKKFLQAKDLLMAKMQSPKASFYANSAALEQLGDSSKKLSKFSEAVSYYQGALKYSSAEHKEKINQKIADCKKNKR